MKIYWWTIKASIRNDLLSRQIKNPYIRINALERIEELLKLFLSEYYCKPEKILEIAQNDFKAMLAKYKLSGELSGAENSVINNIYDYLESHEGILQHFEEPITNSPLTETNPIVLGNSTLSLPDLSFNFDYYRNELNTLHQLFGNGIVDSVYDRLKEIYSESEYFWELQLNNLPDEGIKYLFIAEAPPYSVGGVTYIYNPKSAARTLLKALSKAFMGGYSFRTGMTNGDILKIITGKGLLVFDSIPFAMDYSSKRDKSYYQSLVNQTANTYLLRKINRKDLKWSNDLKIAFGFKRNALTVINAFGGKLNIEKLNKTFSLTPDLICVNSAGYPDPKKLKQIYRI